MKLTRRLVVRMLVVCLVAVPSVLVMPHPFGVVRSLWYSYIQPYEGCQCAQCLSFYFGYQESPKEIAGRGVLAVFSCLGVIGSIGVLCVAKHPVGLFRGRPRRAKPGHCQECGYDLGGLAGQVVCPECGRLRD
jgi:hypothetical protein